jgi:hypothetical protein
MTQLETITISRLIYKRNEERIKIHYPLTVDSISVLKKLGAKYSKTYYGWLLPKTKDIYSELKSNFIINNLSSKSSETIRKTQLRLWHLGKILPIRWK